MKRTEMKWLLLLLFSGFWLASFSQSVESVVPRCLTDQLLYQMKQEDPGMQLRLDQMDRSIRQSIRAKMQQSQTVEKNSSANLIIPVVVYIVHNNGPENISDQQVNSQLNALNNYFDPYGISFCLATMNGNTPLPVSTTTGVMRIQNAALMHHNANTDQALLGATSNLLPARYLRIWVVSDINGGAANGYSVLPDGGPLGINGIVMDYRAFGDITTCGCTTLNVNSNQGKILVHEVGHYLGLYHTFEGACSGMTTADCDSLGDKVCDTPPVNASTSGCPAAGWNTCFEPAGNPDDISNFMDYTSESCVNHFTDGQQERMHTILSLHRPTLMTSENHTFTGISCSSSILAGFQADNYAPCVGTEITFTATPVAGASYVWEFGDGTTATGSPVTHTYTSAAIPATVVMTVSDGNQSASAIQNIYVENCTPIQSTAAHWYWYRRNGLDFSSGAPVYDDAAFTNLTFLNSIQGVQEMGAVQSDQNGNLLFYTDGIMVYNNLHQIINYPAPLHGSYTSLNGVLIVPDPGNSNSYYIFTSDVASSTSGRGLKYTKINMTGTTAALDPNFTNVPVLVPAATGFRTAPNTNAVITMEALTAVASPFGFWLIAGTVQQDLDVFLIDFRITATGIEYGEEMLLETFSAFAGNHAANIKASPDGKKLVYTSINSFVLEFDNCSGAITHPRAFVSEFNNFYGLAFSPDSKLLYTTGFLGDVTQYNTELCDLIPVEVADISPSTPAGIQNGPDGKIYIALAGENHLAVINRPNNLCSQSNPNACMLNANGPVMQNGTTMSSGLPNMIDATSVSVFTNTISHRIPGCVPNQCFTLEFDADVCATTYSWNFGNPASGANNTSSLANPVHTFTGPGTYVITLVTNNQTIQKTITLGASPVMLGATKACLEEDPETNHSVTLLPGQTALWTVAGGTIAGVNNQSNVTVIWTSLPGTVTLTVTDANGCAASVTKTIQSQCGTTCECIVNPEFDFSVDEENCEVTFAGVHGGPDCLPTVGNVRYFWDYGDGSPSNVSSSLTPPPHTFPAAGTYTVCLSVLVQGPSDAPICYGKVCHKVTILCTPKCECKLNPMIQHTVNKECIYKFNAVSLSSRISCLKNVNYYWDFGDGTTSQGYSTGHVFPSQGTYEVCVTMTADNGKVGCTKTVCKTVVVKCDGSCGCSLEPDFTVTKRGECDYVLVADANSLCSNISEFEWDINGHSYHGQMINVSWAPNGFYEICLTVKANSNRAFCKDKICKTYYTFGCAEVIDFPKAMVSEGTAIAVFPNPTQGDLYMAIDLAEKETVSVVLRTLDGRKLSAQSWDLEAGTRQLELDLPASIHEGIVLVEITSGGKTTTEKVFVSQ